MSLNLHMEHHSRVLYFASDWINIKIISLIRKQSVMYRDRFDTGPSHRNNGSVRDEENEEEVDAEL